jgi:hypothetical protein
MSFQRMNRGSASSIRVILKIIERDKINFWPEYDADEERKQAALAVRSSTGASGLQILTESTCGHGGAFPEIHNFDFW